MRQNCAPVVHRNGHSNHVACNSIVPSGRFCSECGARFVCCGLCLTGSLSAPIVPPDASLRLDAGRPSVCRCIRFRISLSSNETGNGLTLPFRLSIPCPRLQRASYSEWRSRSFCFSEPLPAAAALSLRTSFLYGCHGQRRSYGQFPVRGLSV